VRRGQERVFKETARKTIRGGDFEKTRGGDFKETGKKHGFSERPQSKTCKETSRRLQGGNFKETARRSFQAGRKERTARRRL
jgi:hypothetical protein